MRVACNHEENYNLKSCSIHTFLVVVYHADISEPIRASALKALGLHTHTILVLLDTKYLHQVSDSSCSLSYSQASVTGVSQASTAYFM